MSSTRSAHAHWAEAIFKARKLLWAFLGTAMPANDPWNFLKVHSQEKHSAKKTSIITQLKFSHKKLSEQMSLTKKPSQNEKEALQNIPSETITQKRKGSPITQKNSHKTNSPKKTYQNKTAQKTFSKRRSSQKYSPSNNHSEKTVTNHSKNFKRNSRNKCLSRKTLKNKKKLSK